MNWREFGRKQSLPNYKKLSWHLPRETEKNHDKPKSGSWSLGQDLNLGPPEYKGVLTTQPQRLVGFQAVIQDIQ
jgi:hypothetical protein